MAIVSIDEAAVRRAVGDMRRRANDLEAGTWTKQELAAVARSMRVAADALRLRRGNRRRLLLVCAIASSAVVCRTSVTALAVTGGRSVKAAGNDSSNPDAMHVQHGGK